MIPVVVMPDWDAGDYDRGFNDASRQHNATSYQSRRYQMGYEAYFDRIRMNAMEPPKYYGVGHKIECPRCKTAGRVAEPLLPLGPVMINGMRVTLMRWTEQDTVRCGHCGFAWSGFEIRRMEREKTWD